MITLAALLALTEQYIDENTNDYDMEYCHWLDTDNEGKHMLRWQWNTHGAAGGSCWKGGGGAEKYENEKPTNPLYYILYQLEPTLSDKAIGAACGLSGFEKEGSASGYYGNYDHWESHGVCLEDVVDVINTLTKDSSKIPN